MKQKWFTKMAVAAVCSAMVAGPMASCSDNPVTPDNPVEHKFHEDPAKVTLTLVECHTHTDWQGIQSMGGPHQNPDTEAKYIKTVQEMTWQVNKDTKQWEFTPESAKKFFVQKAPWYGGKPAPIYLFFIHYYNAKGQMIDGQFFADGQDAIHQHFFTAENVKDLDGNNLSEEDKQTEKLYDYLYCDTQPWNQTNHNDSAKIVGKTNPVGFKGVLRFLQSRKQFDMRIKLYHGYKSKYLNGTQASPYYKPSNRLVQNGTWDINFTVPFEVFMDRDDTDKFTADVDDSTDLSTIKEDGLDADSNRIIHYLMDAFGIDWQQALAEYVGKVYKTKDHSDAGYWL